MQTLQARMPKHTVWTYSLNYFVFTHNIVLEWSC